MQKDRQFTAKEENLISKLYDMLNSESLEQLVKLLHILTKETKKGTDIEVLKEPIMIFIYENSELDLEPFTHISDPNNLALFISHFVYLNLYIHSESTKKQLEHHNILLNYLNGYQETKKEPLDNETVERLINLYVNFDKDKKIAFNYDERPILFLTIKLEHKFNGSYYHPLSNIILINTISQKYNQKNIWGEYVFFHGLAHALQMKITDSQSEVPKSFKEKIINNLFPKTTKDKLPLMFSDCFTIALMNDTEFEHKNPYIENLSLETVNKIEDYYEWLIEEI